MRTQKAALESIKYREGMAVEIDWGKGRIRTGIVLSVNKKTLSIKVDGTNLRYRISYTLVRPKRR